MIRIGIAGFGKIGQLRFRILEKLDDVKVIGFYDPNITQTNFNIKKYQNYDDLLADNLDVIFLCSFPKFLPEFTIKALKKNIHVFCEKPPARTVSELEKVKSVFLKSNSILKYGFNHRYHYSVMQAKEKIDSGDFGKLLWLRGVYGKAGSIDYDSNWRNYKNISGGGILIDQGIHMLDLIQYLSQEKFDEVKSFISTSYWNIKPEDNAFAILKSKDNVLASLHSSATQWKHKFLLEMCFEEGFINLDGILSSTRSYAPEKLISGKREFEDITFAMGKPIENIISFENDDSWELEIKEFMDAIKYKSPIINGTIDDAIKTLVLVEKVYNENN
jgi:predicted dehydrogenase